jgi:hypothetical protein
MGARWKVEEPTQEPSDLDIAWAAGFIELEYKIYVY